MEMVARCPFPIYTNANPLRSQRTESRGKTRYHKAMKIHCRALLFDLDGVLVDSTPAVARVWTIWANKHGFVPDQVVRQAHGRPSIATSRDLLHQADHRAENSEVERGEIEDTHGVI